MTQTARADATGATALHDAAMCGHPDLIGLLRGAGARLDESLLLEVHIRR